MIDKRLRSEIAQRKRIISAEEALHLYRSIIRFIKSGIVYNFDCQGELISC